MFCPRRSMLIAASSEATPQQPTDGEPSDLCSLLWALVRPAMTATQVCIASSVVSNSNRVGCDPALMSGFTLSA